MSLYVKLSTNFFSHVKTLRLRAAIGDSAFWVPPRIWVYAAEHQPDGDLSKYSPEEVAMLIGYQGDAQALLEALLKAGFIDEDPIRIHGWDDHNGYHKTFSERASKAAAARWKGKKKPKSPPKKDKTGEEKRRNEMTREEMTQALLKDESSNACSIPSSMKVETFVSVWVEWVFYRKEKKKTITNTTWAKQMKYLSEMGVSKAIQSLEKSMTSGWIGLFEPKDDNANNNGNHQESALDRRKRLMCD
jgi:hypothetical protein